MQWHMNRVFEFWIGSLCFPLTDILSVRDSSRAVQFSCILYTPWNITVCRFSVPMLQAIRMVTNVFIRWQWLLKAVCRCGVVERTYRVTLGRDAERLIPYRLGQGWRKYDTRLSLLSLFFISFAKPAPLYCEEYVDTHTHISDCVKTLYILPLLPNNTASETFLHKSERYEVLTGYLTMGRQPGGDWANTWH
jgi:hypothetical protein